MTGRSCARVTPHSYFLRLQRAESTHEEAEFELVLGSKSRIEAQHYLRLLRTQPILGTAVYTLAGLRSYHHIEGLTRSM